MTNNPPQVAMNGKYNQTEAAALLGVDRKTIYRYIKSGLLKAHQGRSGRLFLTGEDIKRCWNLA
jgi:excisionase family DNA binding protein